MPARIVLATAPRPGQDHGGCVAVSLAHQGTRVLHRRSWAGGRGGGQHASPAAAQEQPQARVLKDEVTSRTHVGALEGEGAVTVCLCYLEINSTPSHLRYLLRRLRGRLPAARLLVGLWPRVQAILTDDRLRTALGADLYTCSLRQAVEACLETARADASPPAAEAVSIVSPALRATTISRQRMGPGLRKPSRPPWRSGD
jgi:hypothetical protein